MLLLLYYYNFNFINSMYLPCVFFSLGIVFLNGATGAAVAISIVFSDINFLPSGG